VSVAPLLLLLGLCIVGSAMYSGSETGMYSLSRLRVDAEAGQGRRSARLIRRLLRDESGLLVTILIGNNVMIELSARLGERLTMLLGVALEWREVVLTALLTPFLFLFAELLPKDLFHRRPHALTGMTAPMVAFSKGLFYPLVLVLRLLSVGIERALGIEAGHTAQAVGRESVLEILQESEAGVFPETDSMARNVLALRALPVERVMVPWAKVRTLSSSASEAELREKLIRSPFSRMLVKDASGAVQGYVHEFEVLGSPDGRPLLEHLREITTVDVHMPLDRALAKLRVQGQRIALVGDRRRPLGLVTVKDLVEEISGELARW
jgi:CBS domain containing-hemolysin-like protein